MNQTYKCFYKKCYNSQYQLLSERSTWLYISTNLFHFFTDISKSLESNSALNFFSINVSNTVPSHVFTGISRTRNGVGPLNARTEHLITTRMSTAINLMKQLEFARMETSKLPSYSLSIHYFCLGHYVIDISSFIRV